MDPQGQFDTLSHFPHIIGRLAPAIQQVDWDLLRGLGCPGPRTAPSPSPIAGGDVMGDGIQDTGSVVKVPAIPSGADINPQTGLPWQTPAPCPPAGSTGPNANDYNDPCPLVQLALAREELSQRGFFDAMTMGRLADGTSDGSGPLWVLKS